MKRALLLLALGGCYRQIGVMSPVELKESGRPREAWAALEADAESVGDAKLLALHEAALLHAGGDWAGSEAAFDRAQLVAGFSLLPSEVELAARLRATNALAIRQDASAFSAAFPQRPLPAPPPGQGKVVVVFERGTVPRAQVRHDQRTNARYVMVERQPPRAPPRVQLDEEPAIAAELWASVTPQLSAELELQAQGRNAMNAVNPFHAVQDAFYRRPQWWSAPTEWFIAERDVPPGPHAVTYNSATGRRARVVDVAPGRIHFLVVPQ